ncbi:hypothetical protein C8J41_101397 [Sphingomonas sp. PP-CC-3G-468]|nr:hypothetical protein C8J39_0540 [Sphingomonas sp. PP-CC-1A-547]TCM09891.1 hypothetical protein C8J41_101397 [Sphingomonas sp. PP-CC-3G-468]
MSISWEGFYSGYMSGSEGQGFALFIFADGAIAGADPLGVKFDGTYETQNDGSLAGTVTVSVPAGGTVIQGASAGPAGIKYEVVLEFSPNTFALDFVKLETPLGPVNLRLVKLRELGAVE